jgi:hypothetical protein
MKKLSLILITVFCISCSDDTSSPNDNSSNDLCDEYETTLNDLTELRNSFLNRFASVCNNDEKCIEALKTSTSNSPEWTFDDIENKIEENKQKLEECKK